MHQNIQDVDQNLLVKRSLNWINYQFERINPRGFWTWRALFGHIFMDPRSYGEMIISWVPLWRDDIGIGGRSATVWMNLD